MQIEVEHCDTEWCRFEWDSVDADEVGRRIIEAVESLSAGLRTVGDRAGLRSKDGWWSPLEYASHVRDVLLLLRDRLVVALNEDTPLCKGMFGGSRVDLGLYEGDSAAVVADELVLAASLFVRFWERIPHPLRSRRMVYGYPTVAERDLRWVAAQALHEVEHHSVDVRSLLA